MEPETRELPPVSSDTWLPAPGLYPLDPACSIAEFTVRVFGAPVRGRVVPVDGALAVLDEDGEADNRAWLRIRTEPAPGRLYGPPATGWLLRRWWPKDTPDAGIRLDNVEFEWPASGRLSMHGYLQFGDIGLPVKLAGRVAYQGEAVLTIVATAVLSLRATCWRYSSRLHRTFVGRRIKVLVAAEFRR
jgi:hypothetical protein